MNTTTPTIEQRIEAALAENTTAPVHSGELATLLGEAMNFLYPCDEPCASGERADRLRALVVKLQRRHADVVELETEAAWRRNRHA